MEPTGPTAPMSPDGEPRKRRTPLVVAGVVVLAVVAAVTFFALADGDDDGDDISSDTTEPVDDADERERQREREEARARARARERAERAAESDGVVPTPSADTASTTPVSAPEDSPAEVEVVDPAAPARYGDSPRLDALWDDCEAGDFAACDDLYFDSAPGSDYERYGDTCGNRNAPSGYCAQIYGVDDPDSYGDDAQLDRLWDACAAGDFAACDELYLASPFGSAYEAYGDTCGNRNAPSASYCEAIYA